VAPVNGPLFAGAGSDGVPCRPPRIAGRVATGRGGTGGGGKSRGAMVPWGVAHSFFSDRTFCESFSDFFPAFPNPAHRLRGRAFTCRWR